MFIQKSFQNNDEYGSLYIVGTPIGNLDDMTYRALKTLEEVDIIAAEDTRHTIKLLNFFNIKKTLISYHEHNKETSGEDLISRLKAGKSVALVSDAGMPAISDPGYELVYEALANQIKVIPISGPNAGILGLVASGLSTKRFIFVGFLSRDKKLMVEELDEIKSYRETLILYEAPHRIKKTLSTIRKVLGNRNAVLVRELTKIHEEFTRGTLEEIMNYLEDSLIKGELTLILEGSKIIEQESEESWWSSLSIKDHVDQYIEHGQTVKEAIKSAALDRSVPKREIYQEYHRI